VLRATVSGLNCGQGIRAYLEAIYARSLAVETWTRGVALENRHTRLDVTG
jgi:hypothetical protein